MKFLSFLTCIHIELSNQPNLTEESMSGDLVVTNNRYSESLASHASLLLALSPDPHPPHPTQRGAHYGDYNLRFTSDFSSDKAGTSASFQDRKPAVDCM